MRTMVNADSTVACLPRLRVKDGDGAWQTLTSRLFSVAYDDDLDADSASVTLKLRNHPDWDADNLDPLDTDSSYYANSEALLGHYHEVKLEVSKNAGVNWDEIFSGYAGPGSVSVTTQVNKDDVVTLTPCDLSFPYKEYHFYDSKIYKDADAVAIMTQIFADHGFNQAVTKVDAPGFYVEEIRTGETNVWAAQKALIEPTGFVYRIRWHKAPEEDGAFKPCVYDPDRTKSAYDALFPGTFSYRKLDISEADVRTKVVVIYRNRISGTIEYAQAESEAARDKYGIPDGNSGRLHKTIWLAMQGTGDRYSMIDTPGEAKTLADYVLYDLREPTPDIEVRLPRVHPGIEIHDLLSFAGDDYTVTMGVTSVNWNWTADNQIGETIIRGTTDRVIGEFGLWLAKDAHSPDAQQALQAAFLLGDGKPPARPATPILTSYWGRDANTGDSVPIVVATVTPNQDWDRAGYYWHWQIEGEAETESRTTQEPRLVIKGLPVGRTVMIWVQVYDWSARGL